MEHRRIRLGKKLEIETVRVHLRHMKPRHAGLSGSSCCQHRRRFLAQLSLSATWFAVPGAFAEALTPTPRQTEGPFYPDHLPLDTDNDLIIVNDSLTPAVGEVTWLSGRILDAHGEPIRNALVEIWEADSHGIYLHSESDQAKRDANFQGFGRFLTSSTGEYVFRTIKPTGYAGRAPHIHFAVKTKGRDKFTTQCYVQGEARNKRDHVLRELRDPKARDSVIIPFVPLRNSRVGELASRFDIVLGVTPES